MTQDQADYLCTIIDVMFDWEREELHRMASRCPEMFKARVGLKPPQDQEVNAA